MCVNRVRSPERGRVRTDGGNLNHDPKHGVSQDPVRLADDLTLITRWVAYGLFLDLEDEAIIGTETEVEARAP